MGQARGNFDGSDEEITAKELYSQRGKFGYLWPHMLRISGKKISIEESSEIHRELPTAECIRVESVAGGFYAEFVDFPSYHWMIQKPSGKTISVKQLKADGKSYTEWSDKLLYINLERMPVDSGGFIYRHQIKERGGRQTTYIGAKVEQEGTLRMVPIRRTSLYHFEVQLRAGVWAELVVE